MPVPGYPRYSGLSNGSPSYYCSSATLTMFFAAQTAAVKPTSQQQLRPLTLLPPVCAWYPGSTCVLEDETSWQQRAFDPQQI
eukprot:3932882-Rhodomonas_salina.1